MWVVFVWPLVVLWGGVGGVIFSFSVRVRVSGVCRGVVGGWVFWVWVRVWLVWCKVFVNYFVYECVVGREKFVIG